MTLARRHFQRVTAALTAANAPAGEEISTTAYEQQLAQLYEHKRSLKQIQSIERKIDFKREILPLYAPWIEGSLSAGVGGQDAVLMTVMVWRIDTCDFAGALEIAAYALQHDLVMPDQYQRTPATLIAEEIAGQALQALGTGGTFDADVLDTTEQLTRDHDMPDEVRAKVHKALGLSLLATMQGENATPTAIAAAPRSLEHLRRALQLHDRIGVKKEIERLERFIKNNPAPLSNGAHASIDGASTESPQSHAAEPGASAGPSPADPAGAPAPATSEST